MSASSQLKHLRRVVAVSLLLPLLCACSYYDYNADNDTPDTPTLPTEKYINLSIVVSSGNENTTRAPQGGENGDGREAGSERENKVTGITLMLYQDEKGINTDKDTKIDFIKYFPVTEDAYYRDEEGTDYGDKKRDEARYSTGDQPIGASLNFDTEYHAIVVANWDLTPFFGVGSKVSEIREKKADIIYSGNVIGIDAANFVMSLEKDYAINFKDITPKADGNKLVYNIEDGIHIERLAARVDFWMKGAMYKTSEDNPAYTTPGYEYSVWKSTDVSQPTSNDKFVLTAVTPFNLYGGNEYLFKRITTDDIKTDWSESDENKPIFYLKDEKVTNTSNPDLLNFVLDPYTTSKTGNTVSDYMMADYALYNFLKTDGSSTYESKKLLLANLLSSTVQNESPQSTYTEGNETGDNIIICYPKENTLWKTTELYYYATGLCIEGHYYKSDGSTPEKLTYYGFLRHQGEKDSEAYKVYTKEELKDIKGSFPMNFGVVRNNIYRISIDKITEKTENKDSEITLQIKVKKWDTFTHSTIYM